MRFIDPFNAPTDNWRRGAAVPSRTDGPIRMRARDDISYVTLSGMAVHPDSLSRFRTKFDWTFTDHPDAALEIAIGKPLEWSRNDESRAFIRIGRSMEAVVTSADGTRIGSAKLEELQENKGSVRFEVREDRIIINETADLSMPGIGRQGGYLTIRAVGTPLFLERFELETEIDITPMTAEERDADLRTWMDAAMEKDRAGLAALKEYLAAHPDPFDFGGVDLKLSRTLVRKGERIEAVFTGGSELPEMSPPTLEHDYLGAHTSAPVPLALDWRKNHDGVWRARTLITADRPGNGRIIWNVRGTRISRIFAAVDRHCAVCTLWVGSNHPDLDAEIHRYDLPGDYWAGTIFGGDSKSALDGISTAAGLRRRFGDTLVPFVNADGLLSGIPNCNFMSLPPDLQEEGLRMIVEMWDLLGFGPLEVIGSYTFGHETFRIAEKLGIKAVNSLCIWQNWRDGSDANSWKIDHWGAPNAPYYAAADDFRKIGDRPGIMAFGMGTASSVRNYTIFGFEGCPTLTCPMQRYSGETAQSVNMTRFHDAVNGWIHDTANNEEPVFVTVGLENFLDRPDWAKANELAVDYLVRTAATGKLVFANAAAIADFYRANYDVQPDLTLYQPDIYSGYRAQAKPARLPDRIEASGRFARTLHVQGQALPQFFWDCTVPWNEPEWSDQPELRNRFGLIPSEDVKAADCVPRQADLSGVEAGVTVEITPGGALLNVRLNAPGPIPRFPLAAWGIPLDPDAFEILRIPNGLTFKKVKDGFTGNFHALIDCENVRPGTSEYLIELAGAHRDPTTADFTVEPHFFGRTFPSEDGPRTYLWLADGVTTGELALSFPPGTPATVTYNDGRSVGADIDGKLTVTFDGTWRSESPVVAVNAPFLDINPLWI